MTYPRTNPGVQKRQPRPAPDLELLEAVFTDAHGLGIVMIGGIPYAHIEQTTQGIRERVFVELGAEVLYGRRYRELLHVATSEHERGAVSLRGLAVECALRSVDAPEEAKQEPPTPHEDPPFLGESTAHEEAVTERNGTDRIDGIPAEPELPAFSMPERVTIDDDAVEPLPGYIGTLQTTRPNWPPEDEEDSL